MARATFAAAAALLTAIAAPATSFGHAETVDRTAALEASRAALGGTVGSHRFTDRTGRTVDLAAYRGRPLVVSMIYTSCANTCPLVTQSLANAAGAGWEALGEDSFAVVTIGFDVRNDTPARMRAFARAQGVGGPEWKFLSADDAVIDSLAREIGFTFAPSSKGFDHLAQITVLDADGRVYRQVYGDEFTPPVLVEPLKELVFGTRADLVSLSGLINQIHLFCTVYSPSTGRYRFDYSIFIGGLIGLSSLGAVGFVLVRAIVRARRTGKLA